MKTGPKETVNTLKKYISNKDLLFLDAGCGSGLVGLQLQKFGFEKKNGADLSQKLLNMLPKHLYKKIKTDLNKPIDVKDNFYDVITCVGTFTFGHVKPQSLR